MAGKLNVPSTIYNPDVGVPESEYISPKGWVGQCSAAHGEGMAFVCTWHTPWANRFTHIRNSLGYSKRNGASLSRKLPRVHPHMSWLRATRLVSMEGVHWTGKSGGAIGGFASDYDLARLTYSFTTLPYELKDDNSTAGQEWTRFVIRNQKPSGEFFSREGFRWKYVEGPYSGKDFGGKCGVPFTKKRLSLRWVQVPEAYLMTARDANSYTNIPRQLDAALNTINSVAFDGYPAGTLYFDSYEIEARMEPVPDAGFDGTSVPRTFDVTLFMNYWNPPQGGANPGWNNDPGQDFKWYATRAYDDKGNDSGNSKFVTYDFKQIFSPA